MSNQQISFEMCLIEAAKNKELIKQFDRLHGANLSFKGSSLELAIDKSSGRTDSEIQKFIEFVDKYVYQTLPNKQQGGKVEN